MKTLRLCHGRFSTPHSCKRAAPFLRSTSSPSLLLLGRCSHGRQGRATYHCGLSCRPDVSEIGIKQGANFTLPERSKRGENARVHQIVVHKST